MKLLYKIGACLLVAASISAREFETPTVFEHGYPFAHYPFDRPINSCSGWTVAGWGGALYRTKCRAYFDECDSTTTDKQCLSSILFGKETFKGIDAFATPIDMNDPCLAVNPLLLISELTPCFEIDEQQAWFGMTVEKQFGCDDEWRFGVRVKMPYKAITATLDSCCNLADVDLDDLVKQQDEVVLDENEDRGIVQRSYAWRLDFLSVLNDTANPDPDLENSTKFVKYANTNNSDRVTMYEVDVTTNNGSPIHLIKRPDGTCPKAPFAENQTEVLNEDILPANASGGVENQRFIFDDTANFYAGLNTDVANNNLDNLSQLWVVPTALAEVPDVGEYPLIDDARTIQANFDRIVRMVRDEALDFFDMKDISFDTQCNMGVGDLWTEFYLRYDACHWFGQGLFGVLWPISKEIKDPKKLLLFPTGNNKHWELKIGGYAGYTTCDWLSVKADAFYIWALNRKEKIAAAFEGATVKNIGPTVDADVSWGYFVGNLDFTFSPPCDLCIGADVGYQFYAKQKDDVDFCATMTADLFGQEQLLSNDVAELRTKQQAHKVKAEFFYQDCFWHFYAGFQHVFAGKNITNDTDWYLGLQVFFN